jgi:pyruvate formate lyase activating enzyme
MGARGPAGCEGQRGLCFVRMRRDGSIVLTSYGRSSRYRVDPNEKKPLNHFLPGTPALSSGTAGCSLGCRFCRSWDISTSREIDTLAGEAAPAARAGTAARLGCRSVAFTYNDPVIFSERAADACRELRLEAVAVTAGSMSPGPRAAFYRHIGAANADLKGSAGEFCRRTCLARLDPVLETLRYLRHETSVWPEITNLLTPGLNDSDRDIDAATRRVAAQLGADVPAHVTAFRPDFTMLGRPPTPPQTLSRARRIAVDYGIRHACTGNIPDPGGQGTRCHGCGTLVNERDGYRLGAWRLTGDGRCLARGGRLPGVPDGPPGTRVPRRPPARLGAR